MTQISRLAIVGAVVIALSTVSVAAVELRPCFTPGDDCTAMIVGQIDAAKTELLVQAYGFTNPTIIQAIGRAKERGVDVKVILDKTNAQKRYTGATYLTNHGIPVLIDDTVAIAHNKVIVIDSRSVITGSFNFTQAAQTRNAENVLLIEDASVLAEAYAANWNRRATVSRPLEEFRPSRKDMRAEPD